MSYSSDNTNSSDMTEMLKEIAVFDYVMGNQDESTKRDFEKILEQDPKLKEAVKAEFELRKTMQEAGKLEPVSMSNFDSLLETIDQKEDSFYPEEVASETTNVVSIFKSKKGAFTKYYATAASLAAFVIIFSGLYVNSTTPKFQTLSDLSASQELNFEQLMSENRVAKLTLADHVNDNQVDKLLLTFNLSSFESGAESKQRFVTAKTPFSENTLERLRNDARVKNAELLTVADGG